ncbi:GNAT family N-acetyltransferase [Cytobacillus spongiae]|jgi:RimJ/RimL family protein N-acetyltransferase|uniref:GNAT family N-acetyltransferase n=1 Tax=Cytobacillus spongiae TaxID=2901381 RepID=UPI001F22F797|nr:GNAT family N-acetyltransferase [Cytobacillus spongiae]UII55263.1 GNAT family N-acetyltransferase [Cytobacillus spongiae]
MNVIVETDRLILKVFEEQDVDEAKTFWGDPEVMESCLGATPHEVLPNVLKAYATCHDSNHLSVYAVVEKVSQKVIGAAGFNLGESLKQVELIYHFSKEYWGKGYATEAVMACITTAKQNELVEKISASAAPENASSLKILEKVGFEYQGMKWFEDTAQEEPYYEMKLK